MKIFFAHWKNYLKICILTFPSGTFFIIVQASILDKFEKLMSFITRISSPTFSCPFLSAAPPEIIKPYYYFSCTYSFIEVCEALKDLPVNIFFTTNGTSPSGESLPPSILNPSPAPSFTKEITWLAFFTATSAVGPENLHSS